MCDLLCANGDVQNKNQKVYKQCLLNTEMLTQNLTVCIESMLHILNA